MGGSKRLSLRVPLDLGLAADKEVYEIFNGFKSVSEAKNFLLSAVLYYSRSPLVLSANALAKSLDGVNLDNRFNEVVDLINCLCRKVEDLPAARVGGASADMPPADGGAAGFPHSLTPSPPSFSNSSAGPADGSALSSLRQKFKV